MESKEYLLLEQSKRQSHLAIDEDCIERGGNSTNHRGVLAQYLDTPIYGRPVDLCHACHNGACSNPKHLYWGSRKENIQDSIDNGTHTSPWERSVSKYGLAEATERARKGNKSAGGRGNKGKPKSDEHKKKIADAIRNKNPRW